MKEETPHKKWSFSLRNSSVNVTKSAGEEFASLQNKMALLNIFLSKLSGTFCWKNHSESDIVTKAVARKCFVKKMFWKISQNSLGNSWVSVSLRRILMNLLGLQKVYLSYHYLLPQFFYHNQKAKLHSTTLSKTTLKFS